ncbi:MAG TPA: M1 family aminopeptidase [Vicinamibacteria bacterium]|nr:M1 family aminopeptidase [Vicinamibacteria bacterium]
MERTLPVVVIFTLALLLAGGPLAAQPPTPGPAPSPGTPAGDDPARLLEGIEAAWNARNLDAYLELWDFLSPQAREEERDFASAHLSQEETQLRIDRPLATEGRWLAASAYAFSVSEPRARADEWSYLLEHGDRGWRIVGRRSQGEIDGLVHLSLDPHGYRADGLTLRLEDFELQMERGSIFTSPASLGPTVLVFVGEASVRVSPRQEAEREQLRQFSGSPEMVERVSAAYVRVHPADIARVLQPWPLTPDSQSNARFAAARRLYDDQVERSFLLDAALPRSPWWLLPALGDAAVSFETRRRGTLTFTVSSSEFESISLFDRARRRQICMYPAAGRTTNYNEDAGRPFDVLEHDLSVRFEPSRFWIEAEDTMRIRIHTPVTNLRLRLDDGLQVRSIRSAAGEHLFFRVRGQDSVMVSLGALTGLTGELSLRVRYGGSHPPVPVEHELIQAPQSEPPPWAPGEEPLMIEQVLVYTNRTAWYPQMGNDDFALASLRFDVPQEFTVIAGGTRVEQRQENGRTLVAYRQDRPGKYITAAVGRFFEAGQRQAGRVLLRAWGVPRMRATAAQVLGSAGEILRFYEQEFGPCPYDSLNLVVVEGITPGGHSPPGMVILSERPVLLRRNLRDDPAGFMDVPGYFFAHELAHQWWGHGVAGQNYRERWLSEGFAQYAAALWIRHSRGEGAFQTVLARLARWAIAKSAEGPINLGYRLGHIKGDPQIYRAVVYDKGAYVLHMLRRIVGEEAFRRALIAFQEEHRFSKAGTEDLRQAMEKASGLTLSSYFEQWVYGTALPTLALSNQVESTREGYRTHVQVAARELPGAMPLELSLRSPRGKDTRMVTLEPSGGTWTVETARRPSRVRINEDRGVLARVLQR